MCACGIIKIDCKWLMEMMIVEVVVEFRFEKLLFSSSLVGNVLGVNLITLKRPIKLGFPKGKGEGLVRIG